MTDAYYACHRDDPAFRTALAVLLGEVWRHVPDPDGRIPFEADEVEDPGGWAAAKAVQDFARRWGLPARDGIVDVRAALHLARHRGTPPELRIGVRADWTGFPAIPGTLLGPLVGPDGRARLLPPYGLVLEIDRRRLTRGVAVDRIEAEVDRIRRDLLRQLDEQERILLNHGWVYVPLAYDHPATLRRLAQRLYGRAVHRLAYSGIADDENNAYGTSAGEQAIRESVKHWAEELGVTLPPGKIRSRRGQR